VREKKSAAITDATFMLRGATSLAFDAGFILDTSGVCGVATASCVPMHSSLRELICHFFFIAYAGALAVGLSACSMHPLPDDVPQASTVDIVKSIRCEALAGLESFKPEEMSRAAPIIKATMIGYDFMFDIKENNGANGGSPQNSFLTFMKGDKRKLDLTANAALERHNVRRFTVIEPLADVAKDDNRATCADRTTRANWTYPITGTIGMDEVVRTYLKLEMLTELQNKPFTPDKNRTKFTDVVFADDLTFTTNFRAGAKGTLVLDAVVGRFKVTNTSLNVSASRDDIHSVVVALTRKPVDVAEPRRGNAKSPRLDPKIDRQVLLLSDNVRDPRDQARLIEIDEDARTRVAMELHRRRSLNDVDNAPAEALGQRFLDVLKVP
jgi:hypothetical protein